MGKKISESLLSQIDSPQKKEAEYWTMKAIAETYKGTEAEKYYLDMAIILEESMKD